MTTLPVLTETHARPKLLTWIPALFAVLVICCESQKVMGGNNTGVWLGHLLAWSGHQENNTVVELINHFLRKSGHFTGYGLLGLCFARGWISFLRKRIRTTWAGLRLRAGALGIASAFVVASCDEIHQSFLPGRVSCFSDVMLDTSGALILSLIAFGVLTLRRNQVVAPDASPFTTLGLSLSALPLRVANGERAQRLRQSAGSRVEAVRHRIKPSVG
jgi:VanZ family protein